MRYLLTILLLPLSISAQVTVSGSVKMSGQIKYVGTITTNSPDVPNTLTNGILWYSPMDTTPGKDLIAGATLTDESSSQVGVDPNTQIFQANSGGGNTSGNRQSHADSTTFSIPTNSSFTLTAWINMEGQTIPNNFPVFVDKGCFNDVSGYLLYFDNTTVHAYLCNGVDCTNKASSIGALNNTTWYQAALRWNITNHTMTLNVQGTNNQDSVVWNSFVMTNTAKFSMFAPSSLNSSCWPYMIDDVGLWGRELNDAELQQVYTAGLTYHVGYPFTQQYTNLYWAISARGLNETTVQTYMQRMSWTSNHLAGTNWPPVICMYIRTNAGAGDPLYGSLQTQMQTNFPVLTGSRTNGFVLFMPGAENDIIVLNQGTGSGTWDINTVINEATNDMQTLMNRGYKILAVACQDVVGFTPQEEDWRSQYNNAITNYHGIIGFIPDFMTTNHVPDYYDGSGSEFSEPFGKTNFSDRANIKLTAGAP